MKTQKKILSLAVLCSIGLILSVSIKAERISALNKILVQGRNNNPPFEFINNKGEADGFNVELFKEVMKINNLSYELKLGEWNDEIDSLCSEKIDAIVSTLYSKEKAQKVSFCLPHCEVNKNIICRNQDSYYNIESLRDKEIIVQKGGWAEAYIINNRLTDKIILVNDMHAALRLLNQGQYDAALDNDLVAMFIIKNENLKNLKINRTQLESQKYSIVVNQNNDRLLQSINTSLQELKASGKYDKIYNKWFGVNSNNNQLSSIKYYSFAIVFILIIISTIIVTILRKKIHKATLRLDLMNSNLELSLKAGEVSSWLYNPIDDTIHSLHGETFAGSGITLNQFKAMLHPDDADEVMINIHQLQIGEKKTASIIFRLLNVTGNYSYIKSELIDEVNSKTATRYIIGTQRDVTQQQLIESERKEVAMALKMAIKAASLQMWYYDVESKKFCTLIDDKFYFTDNTIDSIAKTLHLDDVDTYYETFNNLLTGKKDNIEIYIRTYDATQQKYIYWESCFSVVRDEANKIRRIIVNQRDITEKYIRRLGIESAHKSLELAIESAELIAWDYNIASNKYRILFGRSNTNEYLSTSFGFDYCHPDDREIYRNCINQVMWGDSDKKNITVRLKNEVDKFCFYECTISKITNKEGNVINLVGTLKDVSKRKAIETAIIQSNEELKQVNRKNELILNNTNSGLAYINHDFTVEWENISTCSTSLTYEAYKKGEKCYKTAHHRDTPCENCVMQKVFLSKNVERIEFCFENKNTIEVFATPVLNENDEVEGIVIRLDDITQRKRVYQDLANAKEKAERSDKLKSAFLANMSHEIRTPLNAIIGFSELIVSSDDPQEREEYSRIINTNNELLLKLIGDILELSKIESGVMTVKNTTNDFSSCFEDIATMMRPRVKEGVELICKNPYSSCVFEFDRERITQILTNFINNAIKFTSHGYIKMGYEHTGEGIRVYVKDTGIGIAEENLTKVFIRFEKINPFEQGTGLGMTICKAIIEALGGDIGVNSIAGEGSTFWFFITCNPDITSKSNTYQPIISIPIQNKLNEAPTKKGEKTNNILIAEDNESNFKLISAILKKNFQITRAENGVLAVELAKNNTYDAILMDMKMPYMNGLEATKEIRKFDQHIHIIALTAHAFDMDKEVAIEAGCNTYLTKPINREELLKILYKVCYEKN